MANEKRLIDANAVRNALYDEDAITMKGVAIINQFPTVDAVEVVRCKNCKHWEDREDRDKGGRGICWKKVTRTEEDHYCGYGERRTDHA